MPPRRTHRPAPRAPLAITSASLPDGYTSQAYAASVVASGGTPPYTWAIISGALPAGLTGAGDITGAYLNYPAMGAADITGAMALWESWTGRHQGAGRDYALASDFTIQPRFSQIYSSGRKLCLTLKPAYNPVSAADRASMDTMLATMKAAGADVEVSLWAEPFYGGLTAAQFITMAQYYAGTVRKYYPHVFVTSLSSVTNNGENSYYPGDAYVDKVATDYYAVNYVNGYPLDPAAAPADNAVPPKPFGIWESNALLNGGNFLVQPDAGFEAGTAGSLGHWTQAGLATIALSNAQVDTGSWALAITCTGGGNSAASHCTGAQYSSQGLPCSPGDQIQCTPRVRAAATGRNVQAGVQFYTSAGGVISTTYGTSTPDVTTGWVSPTATITAPATAAYCRGLVQVLAPAAGEVHYLDNLLLTNLAKGYNPTQVSGYYTSIQSFMTARQAAGKQNASVLQFNGIGANSNMILAASDSRIALINSLANAMSGAYVISGTPAPAGAGAHPVTVQVTDAASGTVTASLAITVYGLSISTGSLPDPVVGVPYSASFAGTGGVLPYAWAATGLPPGLTLAGATIAGTPTTAGGYTITATLTDALGTAVSQAFPVSVQPPPPVIPPPVPQPPSVLIPVVWGGLNLNEGDRDDGLFVAVTGVDGWYGTPPLVGNDLALVLADGAVFGNKTVSSRAVAIAGAALGPRAPLLTFARELASLAVNDATSVLAITEADDTDSPLVLTAEVRADSDALAVAWLTREALTYQLVLTAADPRLYESATRTALLTVAGAGGTGRVYPFTLPRRYAAADLPNQAQLDNPGEIPAAVTITYTGPLGQSQLTDGISSINLKALIAGEVVYVDSLTLAASAPGGATRASYVLAGSQPLLVPEGGATWSLYTTGSGSVGLEWAGAWA